VRPKNGERSLDGSEHDFYVAVSQRGGNQADDLTVAWVFVTVDELNGVTGKVSVFGECGEECVEVLFETPCIRHSIFVDGQWSIRKGIFTFLNGRMTTEFHVCNGVNLINVPRIVWNGQLRK
jgi:hypothetical protein